LMRILYIQGILSEADPVSRRSDFLPIDNMYMRVSGGMKKCPTCILMVMAVYYWHCQYWKL
jgi:hypothetical protein